MDKNEYVLKGNRSCAGCSLSLSFRMALKALGKNTIVSVPACCFTVLMGMYPNSSTVLPTFHTTFEVTGASATGISTALKALKKNKEITVLGWAGDGGTYDIGIQSLSAAAERNSNFIYVCYDNEAYMNTGTQRSSSTPQGALTTTTPFNGKKENKKNMINIMRAHNIPYLATATAAYPEDLIKKFTKAKSIDGFKYIHLLVPCPPGWGYPSSETIKTAKLAVESGLFDLFEIENDVITFGAQSKINFTKGAPVKKVSEYFNLQKRFSQISNDVIDFYQNIVDEKWNNYINPKPETFKI